MDKVITYSLGEDFIRGLVQFIEDNFLRQGKNISRVAFVFGGRRPSLFLRKELSKRIKKGFYPPGFFSMDEFIEYILSKKAAPSKITDLDASYVIYSLAKQITPDILKGRENFSDFLPWAREIMAFIDQLDLEDIQNDAARNVEKNAQIGYEIPPSINKVLENVIALRQAYHKELEKKKSYSRGLRYLAASRIVGDVGFDEFDAILFCGHFYLQKTEEKIIKSIYECGRAVLFFQGDENRWPSLKKTSQSFHCAVKPKEETAPCYKLSLEAGFDLHSEACMVREILKKIKNPQETVVVLPDCGSLIPLLSEVTSFIGDFNVSMGYPLKRSSLFSLLGFIFKAQDTKKKGKYYAKDYLRVLSQPFVKNLRLLSNSQVTRVLVHKIEEILLGREDTPLGGSLFIKLEDVQRLDKLYEISAGTLRNMGIEVDKGKLPALVGKLHELLFYSWEDISNFQEFSSTLEKFIDVLIGKSFLRRYPLDLKIVEKMLGINEELKSAAFASEPFPKEDIFRIFKDKLSNELIRFSGSPLKGLQILGLLETRSLSFENVIIMDANESVLPSLKVYEPLIPREVMFSVGLKSLERDEEIERYHFTRLISSAKNVFLIYQENREREKSRFVEELIWQKERASGKLGAVAAPRARFNVKVLPQKKEFKKTPQMITALKNLTYSASSVNTYLECPLRFYYQYVLGMKEKEDLLDDVEGSTIGTFIHELLEDTFKQNFYHKRPCIDENFRNYFFAELDKKFDRDIKKRMKSDSFTLKEIMKFRLAKFLNAEQERGVKEIVSLEGKFEGEIPVNGGSIKFTSKVDRIDRMEDESLLVLDYKTGGEDPMPKKLNKLKTMELSRESIKSTVKSFQLPLYLHLVRQGFENDTINAALYYLRTSDVKELFKGKDIECAEEAAGLFMEALKFIVGEILDPAVGFAADDGNVHYCEHCPYFYLCR